MSIASKLLYLHNTKKEIKSAIEEKDVSVPNGTTFREYANKVLEIDTGSTAPPQVQVNLQETTVTPNGTQFDKLPDTGYDGFNKVNVVGDANLRPENIAYGVEIYGVTGTMELDPVMGEIPPEYLDDFEIAKGLYPGDYEHLMILESDDAVAFGFMLTGFTVTDYDESNSEFEAKKWVYVAKNKKTGQWKIEDWSNNVSSNGNSYTKNIRYCDVWIYYGELLIWPFFPGEDPEALHTFTFDIVPKRAYYNFRVFGSDIKMTITPDDGSWVTEFDWPNGFGTATSDTTIVRPFPEGITYKDVSLLHIKITGFIESFNQTGLSYKFSSDMVTITSPLPLGLTNAYGMFSDSKITTIPKDFFKRVDPEEFVNARQLFYNCSGVTTIPDGLLKPLPNLTIAEAMFADTAITSIPEDLFANNPLLEDATSCFQACASITSIPGNLFANNPQLKRVNSMFNDSGITSIPSGLFINNPLLEDVGSVFAWCAALTEVPVGLFYNKPNLTKINNLFLSCSSLVTVPLLFNDVTSNVQNMYAMFNNCKKLKNFPLDIFDVFTAVTNANQVFMHCTGITGPVPDLWNKPQFASATHKSCFYNCVNASNYDDIPTDWISS